MNLFCLLLTAVTAAGGPGPLRPSWERVHVDDEAVVGPVHAMGRDDWSVARGRLGLVTARGGEVASEDTHDHGVLGFFQDRPGSLYALGEGELIWHFDGKTWDEQHVAPRPGPGRGPFAAHMLYVGYVDPAAATPRLVAVGLELALVRQDDGSWASPAPAERQPLDDRGLLGPSFGPPAGCARAAWRWLAPRRGAFTCHDGRLFIWDAGAVVARGNLPRSCGAAPDTLVENEGVLYASCAYATLWKTEGERWRRIVPPPEKGLTAIPSLSFAQGCLFVTSKHTLWRACGL